MFTSFTNIYFSTKRWWTELILLSSFQKKIQIICFIASRYIFYYSNYITTLKRSKKHSYLFSQDSIPTFPNPNSLEFFHLTFFLSTVARNNARSETTTFVVYPNKLCCCWVKCFRRNIYFFTWFCSTRKV